MGWEPPRPARIAWEDGYLPILTNNSGEDFLYMHRQMITHVNGILAQIGDPDYPKIKVWTHIPAPEDPEYPVTPAWFNTTRPLLAPSSRCNPTASIASESRCEKGGWIRQLQKV